MLQNLRNRMLIYETTGGPHTKEITANVAQGLILGSDLMNIAYDGILHLELAQGCCLVRYADDIAATITTKNIEDAQEKLNQVMQWVLAKMDERTGLGDGVIKDSFSDQTKN